MIQTNKRERKDLVYFNCLGCGKQLHRKKSERYKYSDYCRSCLNKIIRQKLKESGYKSSRDISGDKNPNWKGGVSYNLCPGKYGKDKNGLSWKIQRRLAWERDNYTCQICGKTEFFDSKQVKTKPDVHHKIPYRVSGSHDLDNLICVCSSCHKKLEGECYKKYPEVFKSVFESRKDKNKEVCKVCGNRKRKVTHSNGMCHYCYIQKRSVIIQRMRNLGYSYSEIGITFNIDHKTVMKTLSGGIKNIKLIGV